MEQSSAQIFSENWSTYQKLILHNYMHHAEFASKTVDVFKGLPKKDIHLLDIGCGDVIALLPVLQKFPIASYTGYDLSPFALNMAAAHLNEQSFSSVLRKGNMITLIQEEEKQFDLIHSSFAIHHLQDDEKIKLLQACFDRLLSGGRMIYTDVLRQQRTSRDQYIEEYFSYIKNDWPLLAAHEKKLVCDHVRQYDFPGDFEETIAWIKSTGFIVSENYQPDHRHAMLVLNKE